jgi:hypothetical protein
MAHESENRALTAGTELNPCPSSVSAGSIFIRNDAPLPCWFRFNYGECDGWKQLFDANSYALERTALPSGWHFSYIASAVVCRAWGVTRRSALQRALKKVMNKVQRSGCNSFEIASIAPHDLIVLHSVRVTANPRHFSPSPFLRNGGFRYYPHAIEEVGEIFWRAAEAEPQIKAI